MEIEDWGDEVMFEMFNLYINTVREENSFKNHGKIAENFTSLWPSM